MLDRGTLLVAMLEAFCELNAKQKCKAAHTLFVTVMSKTQQVVASKDLVKPVFQTGTV